MPRTLVTVLILALVAPLTACATASKEMVRIPAGEFMMGSLRGEGSPDQRPQHRVYLGAFYMDKYEVTVGEYNRFLRATGYYPPLPDWESQISPGDEYPVVGVSWYDAVAYAEWARKRLPTEAEWDACRAGTTTKYNVGDIIGPDDANFLGTAGKDQWERAAPVGSFAPNAWGLYDMHGNVFEWCQDRYDRDYYEKSPINNPEGPLEDRFDHRVLRGGSWISKSHFRGSASRLSGKPNKIGHNVGFRCVRDAR